MLMAEISEVPSAICRRRARESTASIFQDRGIDPGPTDRTTDVPGSRNRIATDPGKVRGVRQTASPSAQRRVLYARASAVLRTPLACVPTRRVYEQLRERRGEKKERKSRGQPEKEAARERETELGKHHRGV